MMLGFAAGLFERFLKSTTRRFAGFIQDTLCCPVCWLFGRIRGKLGFSGYSLSEIFTSTDRATL